MPKKIKAEIPEQELMKDLRKYKKNIIKWGADDAEIIQSDDVIIDIRVREKCKICESYGSNWNCPPYLPDLSEVRKIIESYQYGIIFELEVPSNLVCGNEFTSAQKEKRREYRLKQYKLIGRLELKAFDDGYFLARGYAGGPCKTYLCPNMKCKVLKEGTCRNPWLASPSMEGMGMNVFRMAADLGWDIYPIGSHTSPDDVPHGTFVGIVFVS